MGFEDYVGSRAIVKVDVKDMTLPAHLACCSLSHIVDMISMAILA